jgi:2-methylcitrate dehydratase PrpD
MQRPIAAVAALVSGSGLDPAFVTGIEVRTPQATVVPLIHHRPGTGLQGKFSLEYGIAAALLDGYPGFASFTDAAVTRDRARALGGMVRTWLEPGGDGLLDGECEITLHAGDDDMVRSALRYPPGSPAAPPSPEQLAAKLADCTAGLDTSPADWTWDNAAALLTAALPR